MTDYDLYSNDWANISLLHSQHLSAETLYHEQMHRWGLQHGRAWGIVQLGEDDLQVYGSESGYEISISRCRAITAQGYAMEIGISRPPVKMQGANDDHRSALVPIYLGIAMEKEAANAGSSQTGALLDRPALRWSYTLTTDPESSRFDWLQIGRMRREGQRYVRDEQFIPQCVFLKSHPSLVRMVMEINKEAKRGMGALDQATRVRSDGADVSPAWLALVGVMVTALAPATIILDWDIHPRQYLERLIIVLKAFAGLMPLLEATNSNWVQANDRIQNALKALGQQGKVYPPDAATASTGPDYDVGIPVASAAPSQELVRFALEEVRPGTFWWDTYELVREAFQSLAILFLGLTPGRAQQQADAGGTVIRRTPGPFSPVKKTF